MRLGDSAEELAEATRLLDYSTLAVEQYAPEAPSAAQNEAVIRLASQMFDQPTATRGAYANAHAELRRGSDTDALPFASRW